MGPARDPCPLCLAEKLTRWFEETDLYWIALCKTCGVPMVMLKRHDTVVTPTEWAHMITALRRVALEFFPHPMWKIDHDCRQIPDHWHAHARPVKVEEDA